jgi:heat shock protein HslJ
MFNKFAFLIVSFFIAQLNSCEKEEFALQDDLGGNWVLKNVFLSDAIDTPCGWEAGEHNALTMNVTKDGDSYSFSGKSAVNNYFGTFSILSYNETTRTGKIKSGPIGSTKMAGPAPLMNCEQRFFNQLETAIDFSIEENGVLKIGTFRNENSHPRDGGYYLIFEKK